MKYRNRAYSVINGQAGVALVVSLILLLLVTMISLTGMRSANLDTRIAVNHQHKQFAFQAAENALAKLTHSSPNSVSKPASLNAAPVTTPNFYKNNTVSDSVDTSAQLTMDMTVKSNPGQYKISGYGLNLVTIVYQADAVGKVDGTPTKAHNRMEVALLRY